MCPIRGTSNKDPWSSNVRDRCVTDPLLHSCNRQKGFQVYSDSATRFVQLWVCLRSVQDRCVTDPLLHSCNRQKGFQVHSDGTKRRGLSELCIRTSN